MPWHIIASRSRSLCSISNDGTIMQRSRPINSIRKIHSENAQGQGKPLVFALEWHPLQTSLTEQLQAECGKLDIRQFPDGESYLRIITPITGRSCIVVADLSHPNAKYLPLIFLLSTLRELGASSVGLVAPYLSYMRQDRRFVEGEAITSKIFARDLSQHIDWLVTVDPHLHRYHSLNEIYSVPSKVVQGAPALSQWLKTKSDVLLIGPDAESEQWVSDIAHQSGHPFVIGEKQRFGDRDVQITLPELDVYHSLAAVIIDDVISSGHTILECIKALKEKSITHIHCAAVHGIFADGVDADLLSTGLESLVTTNTIAHQSNAIDITSLLITPVNIMLREVNKGKQ